MERISRRMPIVFTDYKISDINVEEGTAGGPTYIVNGKRLCFAYTTGHKRAVGALTGGNWDIKAIREKDVENLLTANTVFVNDETCDQEEYPWLGLQVWDEDETYIGEIGARCSRPSGAGTEHKGYGRCVKHAGRILPVGLRHGRGSVRLRKQLHDKIQAHVQRPNLLDLSMEISVQRALLDEIVARTSYADEIDVIGLAEKAIKLADLVGRQAERISAMNQRESLTAAQVLYLQVTIVDMFTKYIQDPSIRQVAAMELVERLGTTGIELDESDILDYDPSKRAIESFPRTARRIGYGRSSS